MRLPRDISAAGLITALKRLDYTVTRQSGSHIRLTHQGLSEHHVTVPNHRPIRTGTLAAIVGDVAAHLEVSREELLRRLFG